MESILDNIRENYVKMGRGEKKIADCILLDARQVVGLSISELAERCGCGDATVVRFARRLGLSGYQSLKIRIAQAVQYSGMDFRNAEQEDSCYDIFLKRRDGVAEALEETRKILSPRSLENAASAILNAGQVLLFGVGFSASVALDMQHKLLQAGFPAAAYADPSGGRGDRRQPVRLLSGHRRGPARCAGPGRGHHRHDRLRHLAHRRGIGHSAARPVRRDGPYRPLAVLPDCPAGRC